ncbi:hypothetical protein [Labilibaculum sp.]|uniref:hypothetical protein n=1 Tax=Labilibaculum sp. TaxID=2060723 RepID=UPI0035687E9A
MRFQFLFILLIFSGFKLFGQSQSNLRRKLVPINRDTIQLDTLLILPASVKVHQRNKLINKDLYQIIISKGVFVPSQQLKDQGESLQIEYRVYDFNIKQSLYKRDLSQLRLSNQQKARKYAIRTPYKNMDSFSGDQLEKQGNYTRGISYGNNQDVVVNSNLNLQLSGKLSNDVSILAAISDNNIPIQPDGNTQTINDFDRIYIQLYDHSKELTLGDFELQSPTGNYMRFYKKVQGGKFSIKAKNKKTKKTTFQSTVSASISKGKFNRMEFDGTEGVQGPYQLTGANSESYIIVLSGSEKIYVDGELLSRGEQNDYQMDYNTAEVTFTIKQPITRNSRIIVEFEYSEENYSRYLLFSSNELKSKTGKFWFNFYHEQDNKNQSIDQTLSDDNKLLLSEVGDDLNLAQVLNVEEIDYSNDYVMYKKITKSVDGINYDVYQYSTNADSAVYLAYFSYMGSNSGNYQKISSTANGRVYEWIDPIDGVLQGEYEPTVQLIAPEKQQMISLGGDLKLADQLTTKFELALSNNDLNSFSTLDDDDNKGLALDFQIEKNTLFIDPRKVLKTELTFHHITKNFSEIEPYRTSEFERDWNLEDDFTDSNENFYSLNNLFTNSNWGQAIYEYAVLDKDNNYQGKKHSLGFQYSKQGLSFTFSGNSLTSNQTDLESKFYRHQLSTSYSLEFAKFGIETESENNQWEDKTDHDLLSSSSSFYSYKLYIGSKDASKNQFEAYFEKRKDFSPKNNELIAQSESQDFGASLSWKKNPKNQLKIESIYRRLNILDDSFTDEEPENTFLGTLEHQARIKKGLLQTSTYYELSSGLESEKEYSFVEVSEGLGVYQWTDYNGNDTKEIDEFEISTFSDEANYLRVSTSTNEYQKVYTSDFRQTFNLRFSQIKSEGKFYSLLKNFNNRFAYRISKKSLIDDFSLYANPFSAQATNENITTLSSSFQNTLSHRKAKSKTNWDLIHLSGNSKQLLTQGFERREFKQNGLLFQWRLGNSNQLSNRIDLGEKSLDNESYISKNYNLQTIKNELKLQFQPTLNFQCGFNYTYTGKENELSTEKSHTHNIGTNAQYSFADKGKLMATFNFLLVDYNDDSSSSIAYEMLEGFSPGNNSTWSLSYKQQLSKLFQLNISYNGRNSEGSKSIHVGNMEVRAYF